MKHPTLAEKQNSRSTLNRKSSMAKLQIGKFVPQIQKKVSKIISNNNITNKFNKTTTSILNKFIDKQHQYDFNSRRQSMQSKVSIGSNKYTFEDTKNYSDQIRQLKYKIKQLTQENFELKKSIENIKNRTNSQKYLKTLDIGDVLEDSNKVLKNKLSTSRRSSVNHCEIEKGNRTSSIYEIQKLYQKAFKQTKMPNIQSLSKAINSYLKQQYQDIYIKLNFLVQNIQTQDQQKLSSLKQILSSMKIPLVYQNNPKGLQKMSSSKKLLPPRSQSSTRLPIKKEASALVQIFAPQLLSPEDTLCILQKLLIRITKSNSMMQSLSQKKTLIKLLKKFPY